MKVEIKRLIFEVFSVLEKHWFKLASACIIRSFLATLASSLAFALFVKLVYWNLLIAAFTHLLVWSAFECGFLKMCLNACRREQVNFKQLFSGLSLTPVFFLLTISYIFATTIGAIALIVPGMFICVRFSVSPIVLIDKKKSLTESLKASYNMTLGFSRLIAPLFLIAATLYFSPIHIQFVVELIASIALVLLYLQMSEKSSGVKI